MVACTYQTAAIAPGGSVKIKVTIKAKSGAPVGATITAKVKVTSTIDTTRRDTVGPTVTRR